MKIWLELCDFTYQLMRKALKPKDFAQKLKRMRDYHLEENRRVLTALARTIK